MHIGEQIKACRREIRATQQQVATAYGCSAGYISQLERGDTDPSVTVLQKLAQALDACARENGTKYVTFTLRYDVLQRENPPA